MNSKVCLNRAFPTLQFKKRLFVMTNKCTQRIICLTRKHFLHFSKDLQHKSMKILIFVFPFVIVVQLLSPVWLFATPWTAARQISLSFTISWNPLKLMSIELVMPYNHFIFHHPLLLLPSIFPSIMVFSNESVLRIRWPKYWSFSFSISPFN